MHNSTKKFIATIAVIVTCILVFITWPLPPKFSSVELERSTKILDKNEVLLYEVRNAEFGAHEYIAINNVPTTFLALLVATEDSSFYSHNGISLRGIARAAWQNIRAGRVVSGGSTITQQLVRNVLRPKKRTVFYKVKEAVIAIKLDAQLSKKNILELYVNKVYFGHQAYGIAAAAKVYFGKSVHELSVAESSLLVGLLQSPSSYNPFYNMPAATGRQQIVLQSAVREGVITQAERDQIAVQELQLTTDTVSIKAPHFVMWLLQQNVNPLHETSAIITTIDAALQTQIEDIIDYQLQRLEEKHVTSAAVVVLDVHTGELLSMVGSADYFNDDNAGKVNSATALRQPGSTLKPFTYALALMQGDTAATTVADTDIHLRTQDGNNYTPRNYDFEHHGLVRYREALANSYNIPAIKVLQKVGIESFMRLLSAAGITSLTKHADFYGLALTLGAGEVSLLELTQAYGMLANQGNFLPITAVRKADVPVQPPQQIVPNQVAWLVTDILSDTSARVAEFGLDNVLEFDFPVAAKTGTTRNARDNWVIGYTPSRVVGVWVGNANNDPMIGTSGITGAGPIFHDVMNAAMSNIPKQDFTKPSGLVEQKICRLSGLLPTELCTNTVNEYFIQGTQPTELDAMYKNVLIDTRNGLLATNTCDPQFTEQEVFIEYPLELQQWAVTNQLAIMPRTYSPLCADALQQNNGNTNAQGILITAPVTGSEYLLDPLVPDANELITLEAQVGAGIQAVDWYINGTFFTTSTGPNFRAQWSPVVGDYTIEARANGQKAVTFITIHK